ncbi:adenylate/guanylate cyclase domain-containing protein [Segetibacter sp. 3557_3]|uniref:adenylate/guanylate cyclase domain-containing protein n=1 Tax=Segetibacter sp. 3557_3 TaxID=2547429 RepID=UPI0010589783|nr:adenylate/guanylate cyclase domain-containing protein [Segetibacter sp. 3557_3]TDH25099.1 adenylate/guanylate cyclase domain-containing protein [Segetibacter sp. 3557_3]
MKFLRFLYPRFSFLKKYRWAVVLYITMIWPVVDLLIMVTRNNPANYNTLEALSLRLLVVLFLSFGMGYLIVFKLKKVLRNKSFGLSLVVRSLILIVAAFIMNFLTETAHAIIITRLDLIGALRFFYYEAFQAFWLVNKLFFWLILFLITQLIIEINEKYAPGVFRDILLGKYVQPKVENRIVMFIDLKDSTPIAEKLGTIMYFKFIRDFIYHVSNAINEYGGRIYQYVGDEVVASWMFDQQNTRICMSALIEARKNLQKHSEDFRRRYGIIPEFRVGIHCGEVTVGEIGVIKKDLAMSGDTMNTTARIRSACSELNQKFIVSKAFRDNINLEEWQSTSLGLIELKGKGNGIELFALKI